MIKCNLYESYTITGSYIGTYDFPVMPRKDEFIIFNNKLYVVVDVRYVLLDNGTVDKAHIFITENK